CLKATFSTQLANHQISLAFVYFENVRVDLMSTRKKTPLPKFEHAGPPLQAPTRKYDREKFVGLANKRVIRAIKAIQLIGNLSNRSNYDYTDEDVDKILKAL